MYTIYYKKTIIVLPFKTVLMSCYFISNLTWLKNIILKSVALEATQLLKLYNTA